MKNQTVLPVIAFLLILSNAPVDSQLSRNAQLRNKRQSENSGISDKIYFPDDEEILRRFERQDGLQNGYSPQDNGVSINN